MTKPENMTLEEMAQWDKDRQFYLDRKHGPEEAARLATESLTLARRQKFENIRPQQSRPWGQRRRKP
ncbi:MAG TPA: hypothetical protein VGK01_01730 [Candidatus Angelobacter sp.]|jgi:hypothetical protein